MSVWQRVSRGETTVDFVGLRRRWFAISALLLALSLLALGVRRLNLGLEFVGGVAVQAPNQSDAEVSDFRQALEPLGVEGARIQLIEDGQAARVQTGPLDPGVEDDLIRAVAETAGVEVGEVSAQSVGPTFGALVARRALTALGVFLGVAALFITWRLQWKMAGAGLLALVHDLILTVGIYAVTGFEVTPATVVAILTILGYSLYDTVVVFDRVEQMEHELGDRLPYSDIVNRSMNQVLVRSLATSLTSLLPVGSLLFVGSLALGAAALRDFALALFVGIAAGTYSSIFVAGPLLAAWKEREPGWRARREKLAARQSTMPAGTPVVTPQPRPSRPPAAPPTGVIPRPPKKRRR